MATLGFQPQQHHHFSGETVQSPTHDQALQYENQVIHTHSLGHWLPKNRHVIASWVAKKAEECKNTNDALDPSLEVFQKLVNGDPKLQKLANDMFTEASTHYPQDPVGNCAIQNFEQFLYATNNIIKSGPQWYDKKQPATAMGMIGFPINALLDWPMGTASGYEFWLLPEVNVAMSRVLKTWGKFLVSPASTSCLNQQNGWLSQDAQGQLAIKANDGATGYSFQQLFLCDPTAPNYGFNSWDAFFVREFREGMRPIEFPEESRVITNACESAPLQVRTDVKLSDLFFLKDQPYSLLNMLNMNNNMAQQFVGGTVYQAFLSAMSYHRWHAPVSGVVKGIEMVPGTYYSENWFEGLAGAQDPDKPDPAAPNYSQPYISAVATRGIIYIEANDPKIGLMAIVFIGMAEVSSCEFTVGIGDAVHKGQQIGMFHFGGSSHCMLYRPGVNLGFVHPPPWNMDTEENFRVGSALAMVL
ncbi:hypothetical protein N0V82_010001 [Gnomoniopsis sp. IMI 355080]|nr:hypothetical protein N0V82_010001 [Gnomoniopsis sp. IMI 355080]